VGFGCAINFDRFPQFLLLRIEAVIIVAERPQSGECLIASPLDVSVANWNADDCSTLSADLKGQITVGEAGRQPQ
jgi:hypothetical protein